MTHEALDFCDFLEDVELDRAQFESVYNPTPEDWTEYKHHLDELDRLDTLECEAVCEEELHV